MKLFTVVLVAALMLGASVTAFAQGERPAVSSDRLRIPAGAPSRARQSP